MATILPFVIRPGGRCRRPAAGGATIVIFPGVRYEHAGDPGSAAPPKAASGGRRGRKTKAR